MLALIMSVRQPCQSCLKVVCPGCCKVGHYPAVRCEGKDIITLFPSLSMISFNSSIISKITSKENYIKM